MLTRFRVSEPLSEAEIDYIDVVLLLADSNEEVIGLDVSVQEVARVDELDSLQHLVSQHKDCLEGELTLAVVEQVL